MDHLCIETFLAIAGTGSLSQAAACLYLAQSSVSHRLRTLEDELGYTLIKRSTGARSIQLTPMGEQFLPLAQQWAELYRSALQLRKGLQTIRLSVGTVGSLGYLVVPTIKKLLQDYSSNTLYLTALPTELIYQGVVNGTLDIGVVTRDMNFEHIKVMPLFNENYRLLRYSTQLNPFSGSVSLKDLDPTLEVFHPWSGSFLQWHNDRFPIPQYYIKFNSFTFMRTFMEDLDGHWSIVPESVASLFAGMPHYEIIEITDKIPTRLCYLITRKFPHQECIYGVKSFIELLSENLARWESNHVKMIQDAEIGRLFTSYNVEE